MAAPPWPAGKGSLFASRLAPAGAWAWRRLARGRSMAWSVRRHLVDMPGGVAGHLGAGRGIVAGDPAAGPAPWLDRRAGEAGGRRRTSGVCGPGVRTPERRRRRRRKAKAPAVRPGLGVRRG